MIGLFPPVDTAAPTPVAVVVEEQAKPTVQEVAAPELDEAKQLQSLRPRLQ